MNRARNLLHSEYGNLPRIPRGGEDGKPRLIWTSSRQSWEEITNLRLTYSPAQRARMAEKILKLSRALPRADKSAFDCMRERRAV